MSIGDNIVEIHYSGAWHDITDDVQLRGSGISIRRGRTSEASTASASECALSLNNGVSKVAPTVTGRYSPRNPNSDLYGLIGRNTPLRVRVDDTVTPYVRLSTKGDYLGTSDKAAVSITGDIDVRFDGELEANRWDDTTTTTGLCGKYDIGDVDGAINDRAWAFYVFNGHLRFRWSADGTTTITSVSTAVLPFSTGRHAVRATLDVNNGAAGNTVTFYTADTMAGSWTQLGSPVVTASTTSIFNNAADIEVGGINDIAVSYFAGKLYGFELRNGIAGSKVAEIVLTGLAGQDDFSDGLGNTWEFRAKNADTGFENSGPSAMAVNPNWRFTGEVVSWPQEWDQSGSDFWVPVQATGALRRLARWNDSLQSTLRRFIPSIEETVAYWPLEDPEGALNFASAPVVNGGRPETGGSISGAPQLASFSDFPCSNPLPVSDGGRWRFLPSGYGLPGEVQVRFLMHIPASTLADSTPLIDVYTLGSIYRYRLVYKTGAAAVSGTGNLRIEIIAPDGTSIAAANQAFDKGVDDALMYVSMELETSGADVVRRIRVYHVGDRTTQLSAVTVSTTDVSAVSSITISPTGALDGVTFGHLTIENQCTSMYDRGYAVNAYQWELAHIRFARLCLENNVPVFVHGTSNVVMGYQRPGTLLDLLDNVEAADLGYLYEPREQYGLAYRCRRSMHLQDPTLELDYATSDLSEFKPVEDDQATKNSITVTRDGGSRHTAILTEGALSVQQPPDGVGVYTDTPTITVLHDLALRDNADWRLAQGTIDEPRYPAVGVELARSNFTADSALTAQAMAIDVGDRFTVESPPQQTGIDDVSQIAIGFDEQLTKFQRTISVVGSPEVVNRIGRWSSSTATDATADIDRYDTDGSTLWSPFATIGTTDTTIEVVTTDGAYWSSDADDLPYDIVIGGERMTVTAVTPGADEPAFVGIGTAATGNNASVTPGLPAGIQAGDLVLIFASIRNAAASVGTPANWTSIATVGVQVRVIGRIYDGVWTMPTVTFSGGSAGDDTIGQSCAFRYVAKTLIQADSQSNASAQNITVPAQDITYPGAPVVHVVCGWKQDDWTSVAPISATWTEIEEKVATAGNDAGQVWDYLVRNNPASPDFGGATFTVTGGVSAISKGLIVTFVGGQQFTVTRSVNGVVKTHSHGADIRLADPKRWSY